MTSHHLRLAGCSQEGGWVFALCVQPAVDARTRPVPVSVAQSAAGAA
jgi:hypothetical protein